MSRVPAAQLERAINGLGSPLSNLSDPFLPSFHQPRDHPLGNLRYLFWPRELSASFESWTSSHFGLHSFQA